MAQKVKVELQPKVVLYVFRHGHADPAADGDAGDFTRVLSEKGKKQAEQLGRTILAADVVFDQIICSAACRAQATAAIVGSYVHLNDESSWYNGEGWEFYSPTSAEDNAALWAATHMVEDLAKQKKISSAMSYSAFKACDTRGFMNRFMDETRRAVLMLPGIENSLRIAIFNHAVIGNAVAEALFPQHRLALEKIELGPCDGIRLTASTCQHLPLMT